MERQEDLQIDFLYRALAEAQDTIKFTDTKAGTIILLVGGLLAFVGAIYTRIDTLILQVLTTVGLAHLLIAAVCSIWALHPRVNPEHFVDLKGVDVTPLYHLRSVPETSGWRRWLPLRYRRGLELSAAEFLRHLDALDGAALRRLLVYELMKVSFIRDEKIFQVAWSIRLVQIAGGFFALLVMSLYLKLG
ncbi:MAG: hypothetical protein ACE5HC_09255 [Candidatus Binatia bacterium]